MPGTKRKASFAASDESPKKIFKRTTSTTVAQTLSTVQKKGKSSMILEPVKVSSMRMSKTTIMEVTF